MSKLPGLIPSIVGEKSSSHNLSGVPHPSVHPVTVCARSFVTLRLTSSLAPGRKGRYALRVRILKQFTFALAALFVAGLLARLAAAAFMLNQPKFLAMVVFAGVFLVTFTGLLFAGIAFLVETSLTRSQKRTPDQISWNWY